MTTEIPICFRCRLSAEEIGEYVDAAHDHNADADSEFRVLSAVVKLTPTEWMRSEEGTYSPETNRFCCTKCYIAIGMPVTSHGWRAPLRVADLK